MAKTSVLDYGAKGDGAHDDTAAFKKCFAAVKAARGEGGDGVAEVPAPKVRYILREDIAIPPGVVVQGEGKAVILESPVRDF